MKMADEFEEHAGAFKNEAELDEELDAEGLDPEEVWKRHFEGEAD